MTHSEQSQKPTVLVTVTGQDHPGITAAVTQVIADSGVPLLDVEQVVVQGQLTLCLLLGVGATPGGPPVLKDLLFAVKNLGLDMQFRLLGEPMVAEGQGASRFAISAIGEDLDAGCLHQITAGIAQFGGNIESIRRLSDACLSSVELIVSLGGADEGSGLRGKLMRLTQNRDLDIAVQPETLTRRSKRLIVMDMDSTLIQCEVIDELARAHGVFEQVSETTHRAMAGELDFEASLRARVALLEGMSFEAVLQVVNDLPLTQGASDLLAVLRKLGYRTGVISGGFTVAVERLQERLGLDYAYANTLDVVDGRLSGRVAGPIVTPTRKAELLETIAQGEEIALDQTIAVGDGANDLAMLQRAGLGIAFHAKPKLKEAADTAISAGGLDRILYLLGLHARDVGEVLG